MRSLWKDLKFLLPAFVLWRVGIFFVEAAGRWWWPSKFLFLGTNPWANFDGLQYVVIATQGYLGYQQAYFPLYPMLIALVHVLSPGFPPVWTALIISHIAFFFGLLFFYQFAKSWGETAARWSVVLLLAYPASFYFASAYTESLFFALAAGFFLSCQKKRFGIAAIFALLASATRLFGVLLWPYLFWELLRNHKNIVLSFLAPVGLIAYMVYLWHIRNDPLAFIHVQPHFGANRTGGAIVLLPVVFWRYLKIFLTVSKTTFSYWVAVFEAASFVFGAALGMFGFLNRKTRALALYGLAVLLVPTLTGTLSSIPRYMLSAFPLFIVFAMVHNNRIKTAAVMVGIAGLTVATSLFLAGYFIS